MAGREAEIRYEELETVLHFLQAQDADHADAEAPDNHPMTADAIRFRRTALALVVARVEELQAEALAVVQAENLALIRAERANGGE